MQMMNPNINLNHTTTSDLNNSRELQVLNNHQIDRWDYTVQDDKKVAPVRKKMVDYYRTMQSDIYIPRICI